MLQCIYMHNKENLMLIQIHAGQSGLESPALSLSLCFVNLSCLYARLSLPHIEAILSVVIACLPYLAMVLVL